MENTHILNIRISDLENSPFQGRLYSINDELPPEEEKHITELKNSIELNGLMQPIVVRAGEDGKYEIIDGHRRVIAYRRLGRGQIRAIVKDYNDRQAQVFSLVGNLQREDLSTFEQAVACEKIIKSRLFSNQRELSKHIGKDETYVSDLLSMLKMDKRILDDLTKNRTVNDVRIMRMIRRAEPVDDKGVSDAQVKLYQIIRDNNLSRREAANLIAKYKREALAAELAGDEPQNSSPVKRMKFQMKQRVANVKIDLQGLQQGQKNKIGKLIERRMAALEEEIKDMIGEVE